MMPSLQNDYARPLLCRSPLFPDESLSSYLARMTTANCYQPASLLRIICSKQLAKLGLKDRLPYPRYAETFDILSSLTGASPRDLANASPHRFAQAPIWAAMNSEEILLSDGQPLRLLNGHVRSTRLRKDGAVQFCPSCLHEAAYHRLIWMPVEQTACPRHQCLLMNRCPGCSGQLSVLEIVQHRCSRCDADLATATPRYVPEALDSFAQTTIQIWWGLNTRPADYANWGLPAQSETVLHSLFSALVDSARSKWERDRRCAIQEIEDWHSVYMAAFKALVNWPHGFSEFFRDCLKREIHRCSYRYDLTVPVYLKYHSQIVFWLYEFRERPGFDFVTKVVEQCLEEQEVEILEDRCARHIRYRIKVSDRVRQDVYNGVYGKYEQYWRPDWWG